LTWWGSLVRVQSRLPNKSALLGGEKKGESKDSPFFVGCNFYLLSLFTSAEQPDCR
jgi:hypothetical protein